MYISMIPDKSNKVINASQGDVNRKFEFIPYDNEGLVDISNIQPNPLPSYETQNGGTETLLPINTSTPTTTPLNAVINGDDVYFNERVSDGNTQEIEKIKGNTLVWNQLNNPITNSSVFTFSNGIYTGTATATGNLTLTGNIAHQSGHKYLCYLNTLANPNSITFTIGADRGNPWITSAGTVGYHSIIYTNTYTTPIRWFDVANKDLTGIKFNLYIIDLTLMFGSGNEPTSITDFTNLFPLSYYDYNAGSLFSFNGTGIKSTGKNLFNLNRTEGTLPTGNVKNFEFDKFYVGMTSNNYYASFTITNYEVTNESVKVQCSNAGYGIGFPFKVKPNTTYTISFNGSNGNTNPVGVGYYDNDGNYLSNDNVTNSPMTFTTPSGCYIADIVFRPSLNILTTYSNIQLEIGSQATTYEPYTENTIDLPISTYFPNGMKSAGSIYDELTESKAITRIGMIDLSTLSYTLSNSNWRTGTNAVADMKKPANNSTPINAISTYTIKGGYYVQNVNEIGCTTDGIIYVNNGSTTTKPTGYLYYELKTPTEEDIETATLETNYCSVDLELEDDTLVCYTTEELTAKAGRHECKISMKSSDKISSAKFYLNVEARP